MKKRIVGFRAVAGFTLIELLVVISVIGILAALGLVSYTTAQRQARDTKRKSDLSQYSSVLETYANKNGGLFVLSSPATSATGTLCTALVADGDLGSTTNCPEDPKYNAGDADPYLTYQYETNANRTKYALWAKLESAAGYWLVCSSGVNSLSADAPTIVSCN